MNIFPNPAIIKLLRVAEHPNTSKTEGDTFASKAFSIIREQHFPLTGLLTGNISLDGEDLSASSLLLKKLALETEKISLNKQIDKLTNKVARLEGQAITKKKADEMVKAVKAEAKEQVEAAARQKAASDERAAAADERADQAEAAALAARIEAEEATTAFHRAEREILTLKQDAERRIEVEVNKRVDEIVARKMAELMQGVQVAPTPAEAPPTGATKPANGIGKPAQTVPEKPTGAAAESQCAADNGDTFVPPPEFASDSEDLEASQEEPTGDAHAEPVTEAGADCSGAKQASGRPKAKRKRAASKVGLKVAEPRVELNTASAQVLSAYLSYNRVAPADLAGVIGVVMTAFGAGVARSEPVRAEPTSAGNKQPRRRAPKAGMTPAVVKSDVVPATKPYGPVAGKFGSIPDEIRYRASPKVGTYEQPVGRQRAA